VCVAPRMCADVRHRQVKASGQRTVDGGDTLVSLPRLTSGAVIARNLRRPFAVAASAVWVTPRARGPGGGARARCPGCAPAHTTSPSHPAPRAGARRREAGGGGRRVGKRTTDDVAS